MSLAVGTESCGASTQSPAPGSSSQSPQDAIENSAKRLAGEFTLISVEDPYRQDAALPQLDFSFDQDGNFRRKDNTRIEEGVYLITPKSELVIYVEKVNGEQRPAAKVERYQISEERDDGFTLQEGSSRRLIFRKR